MTVTTAPDASDGQSTRSSFERDQEETIDQPTREKPHSNGGDAANENGDTFTETKELLETTGKDVESDGAVEVDKEVEIVTEKEKVPDGGYGWFIVLGAFLVHVLMGGFERSNGVMYLQMKERFNRSATETAWVLSIFSTLRLALGPMASALSNKYSCRVVTYLGTAICFTGVLLSGFMTDLPYLYITYGVLGGWGRSFTYTPSLIMVGYYFNKKRGIAVGLATSGVGFGCFTFPPLIEIMFNYYGFQGTFLILAGVISNFLICGALFRPLELHQRMVKHEMIQRQRTEALANGEPIDHLLPSVSMATRQQNLLSSQSAAKMSSSMEITANFEVESRKASLWQRKFSRVKSALKGSETKQANKKPLIELSLLRNYAFAATCIQLFLYTLSFNSTFVFLPALAKEKGVSQIQGAYLVSILGFCDMIARIAMSSILDMKQVKPYRLYIYNAVMFLNAGVAVLLPLMTTFWHFAIISGLYGFLSGTYISQKSVIVVDILGVEKLANSFGLLLLFQGLSALCGPTIGGLLKDLLGSYEMSFYFGSIGIVIGGFVMASGNVWMYRQKQKEHQTKQSS